MVTSPVVETRALTKRYGEFTALESLSISVDAGQILGFIGPNGAGKTTTIRILVGLLRPTEGSAVIAGADCVTQRERSSGSSAICRTYLALTTICESPSISTFGRRLWNRSSRTGETNR